MIVQANGSSFNCRTDGDRGPWVMLSHGLATDMSMWDELTEALSDRYRVLRYDARGHGESAAPAGDYTLDMLVADAVGILDALGVGQTHFAGLSMGGMIAIGMLINHPKRVKSAVIADSRHTTTPEFTEAWLQRADTVRKQGIEAIVESTVSRWSSAGLAERNPAATARMSAMVRKTSANGYCGCAAALARLDYGSRLKEINAPALVICGSEDHGAPPANSRQMQAMIKDARFLEIEQAGHISNIEQPIIFNAAVRNFLDDVSPGRRIRLGTEWTAWWRTQSQSNLSPPPISLLTGKEQEIIVAEQRVSAQKQGIFSVKSEVPPNEFFRTHNLNTLWRSQIGGFTSIDLHQPQRAHALP